MSKGVLIYALNNEQIDYIELALYAAKSVKKHLGVPVALVTDSSDWLKKQYPEYNKTFDFLINIVSDFDPVVTDSLTKIGFSNKEPVYQGIEIDKWYPNLPYLIGQHVFYNNVVYICKKNYSEGLSFSKENYDTLLENVKDISSNIEKDEIFLYNRNLYRATAKINLLDIEFWKNEHERQVVLNSGTQYRKYFDGALTHKRLKFKNDVRVHSFSLSPFDETLVIDCDYIVNNSVLRYCWEQEHDFLIHKTALDLSGYRYDLRLHTISDKSIDFYWATVFYFKKNENTKVFFDLLGHIQDNWNFYRYVYQIEQALYRNDFAFSIAIHIMNGYQNGLWAQDLPGKLYYVIDKDVMLFHSDNEMKFLVEKEKYRGEYTLIKTKDISVHFMNKFSLARTIRGLENV